MIWAQAGCPPGGKLPPHTGGVERERDSRRSSQTMVPSTLPAAGKAPYGTSVGIRSGNWLLVGIIIVLSLGILGLLIVLQLWWAIAFLLVVVAPIVSDRSLPPNGRTRNPCRKSLAQSLVWARCCPLGA
jgi:hypothetical protein